MYIIISSFIIFLTLNAVYNFYCYRQCSYFLKEFNNWLYDEDYKGNLEMERERAIQLVKQAGVYDVLIPTTRAIGYGQVVNANINPMQQFPNRMLDVATQIVRQLESAKGVYILRIKYSYNPILWIELFIFLPSKIITYLGVKSSVVKRAFNIIWWFIVIVIIPVLITIYSDELYNLIRVG